MVHANEALHTTNVAASDTDVQQGSTGEAKGRRCVGGKLKLVKEMSKDTFRT